MAELDFKGLADFLLGRAESLLHAWLPGGRVASGEYVCGNIRGGPGDSLKVSLKKGAWQDFAGSEKGGDLVSLYAAIEGIKQGEAARRLAEQHGYNLGESTTPRQERAEKKVLPPPTNAPTPPMQHAAWGRPSASWTYRDAQGRALFHVARYQTPEGKEYRPWSWSEEGKWIPKGWPIPRPLYGLDILAQRPQAPVMVVEGEKACEAARKIAGGHYAVITWPNGSQAAEKADWTPLRGRKVIIWPDADEPGQKAAAAVAEALLQQCPEVKVIGTEGMPEAWDAADALADKWDWTQLLAWAKPRVRLVEKPAAPAAVTPPATQPAPVPVQASAPAPTSNGSGPVVAVQVNVFGESDQASASMRVLWENLGLALTDSGSPIPNMDNVLRVFYAKPEMRGAFWFDEFHRKLYTSFGGERREWRDVDALNLTAAIQRELGIRRMSDETVYKAVTVIAHRNIRNEPREWMESLKWDGGPRIDDFFVECLGARDSEYARAASRNFWIGMAARIYRPGCKLDNMVVLQGGQGVFKSTALEAIGGPWYTVAKGELDRDFLMLLQGKLVVEIAELDSFGRAEITTIKNIVSSRTDRFRAPYGRSSEDYPRTSVFVGTTNEQAFLKDMTGNRRFWPITCTAINIDMIESAREQCFAEAVARFKKGETWYEMPKDETEREQEARRQTDEWEDVISDWLQGQVLGETTIREIWTVCLKSEIGRLNRNDQHRIGAILRLMGWTRKERRDDAGARYKVWVKKTQKES